MKLILAAMIMFSSVSSFAGFYPIKEKICDNKNLPVKEGERIFIDSSAGIFGIGYTDDNNCRVVDFKSVLISEASASQINLTVGSSIGRKSSCGQGILPYEGLEYSQVVVQKNSVEFTEISGLCTKATFKF